MLYVFTSDDHIDKHIVALLLGAYIMQIDVLIGKCKRNVCKKSKAVLGKHDDLCL